MVYQIYFNPFIFQMDYEQQRLVFWWWLISNQNGTWMQKIKWSGRFVQQYIHDLV